jgi:Peptidase family M48
VTQEARVQPERKLQPLSYHSNLVSYLKSDERDVWEWSLSADVRKLQADEMRDAMLRQTYRLEPEAHPDAYAACKTAMDHLGIDAPATLYQAADGMMNAALCFIPGEVHLIFYGPVLEKLNLEELLALMGHELAHYVLWTADDGAYYNASRILDHALSYRDASPSHQETARLFSLHTELFADRGAALVTNGTSAAISVLVKIMTGLASIDPASYLRQAEELDTKSDTSDGHSHPETFVRVRALDQWWRKDAGLDDWIEKRICGPISIEALDLLRQQELGRLTRSFLAKLVADMGIQSAEVLTQVRRFFPNFQEGEDALDLQSISGERIDDATRGYFISLMFDCAMADADARDEIMLTCAKAAKSIGADELFVAALKRDLKWTKAAADKLLTKAAKAA